MDNYTIAQIAAIIAGIDELENKEALDVREYLVQGFEKLLKVYENFDQQAFYKMCDL